VSDVYMKNLTQKVLICVAVILACRTGMGQSNGPAAATNWGKSVLGVQLSITMTNSVFEAGSSTTVGALIRNSSTNPITLGYPLAATGFIVLVTNEAGKSYHIEPVWFGGSSVVGLPLNPEETRAWTIPVTFGPIIAPGDYTLIARRNFNMTGLDFPTLESNPLKVQVK